MRGKIKYSFLLLIAISMLSFNLWANAGIRIETTFVLQKNQIPASLRTYNAARVYILYSGSPTCYSEQKAFRNDTIINFKLFLDSLKCGDISYRLIFQKGERIDSVWQTE